jgi:hypothetical protein
MSLEISSQKTNPPPIPPRSVAKFLNQWGFRVFFPSLSIQNRERAAVRLCAAG